MFITSGTTFDPPANYPGICDSVECIGGGGGGGNAGSFASGGGGGGGYSIAYNVVAVDGCQIQIGAAGGANSDGGDTWFNGASLGASSCGAKGGTRGNGNDGTAGTGGAAGSGVGDTKYSGGNGGGEGNFKGGGGGGAAGPGGNGATGGEGNFAGSAQAGAGGGGAGGGSSTQGGGGGSNTQGGDGGLGPTGTAGGVGNYLATGGAGSEGSGGGGSGPSAIGGAGGNGIEWDSTHGAGGGGGGGATGGAGGSYGGGGGSCGWPSGTGGVGGAGIIVVTYTEVTLALEPESIPSESIVGLPSINSARVIRLAEWNVLKHAFKQAFSVTAGERSRWNVINDGDTLTANLQQYSEWYVHTTVAKSASTTWHVIAQNVQGEDTSWKVRACVNRQRVVRYNVSRAAKYRRTTYWNVGSGALTCLNPLSSKTINTTARARWNVGREIAVSPTSPVLKRSTRWNDLIVANKTKQAIFQILVVAPEVTRVVKWNVRKYTVATTINTKWHILKNVEPYRETDWQTRQVQGGTSQRQAMWDVTYVVDGNSRSTTWQIAVKTTRGTTWDVLDALNRQRITTWNVQKLVTKSVGTTWHIAANVGKTREAIWNVFFTPSVQRDVDFNVLDVVSLTRDVSWHVFKLVNESNDTTWNDFLAQDIRRSTFWDYSVVGTSVDTTWNIKKTSPSIVGTLWGVFEPCQVIVVQEAVVSKVTTCQIQDNRIKKNYISKYDKTLRSRQKRAR